MNDGTDSSNRNRRHLGVASLNYSENNGTKAEWLSVNTGFKKAEQRKERRHIMIAIPSWLFIIMCIFSGISAFGTMILIIMIVGLIVSTIAEKAKKKKK